MSTLFEQAARLNNDGIDALVEGDTSTAIASMTKSIKLMKQELANPSTDSATATATAKQTTSQSQSQPQEALETVEVPDMDSSEHVVFNQAICIPCADVQASIRNKRSELDIHVYSAAIIFNLALAHHQQALKGDLSFLNKAEKLYAMVLKLIDDSACHLRTAVIVKLATINNLAQVQFQKGDFDHARQGLNQVSGFMRKANQRLFEEPQVQGLLMNVLLLKAPKVAPAA